MHCLFIHIYPFTSLGLNQMDLDLNKNIFRTNLVFTQIHPKSKMRKIRRLIYFHEIEFLMYSYND